MEFTGIESHFYIFQSRIFYKIQYVKKSGGVWSALVFVRAHVLHGLMKMKPKKKWTSGSLLLF